MMAASSHYDTFNANRTDSFLNPGDGPSGAAAAYMLAKAGIKPVVLDPAELGIGSGAKAFESSLRLQSMSKAVQASHLTRFYN